MLASSHKLSYEVLDLYQVDWYIWLKDSCLHQHADASILHQLAYAQRVRDIERETFDFKGTDFDELYKHLCTFAHFPVDGIMVLG
jgi:hypothetical protein